MRLNKEENSPWRFEEDYNHKMITTSWFYWKKRLDYLIRLGYKYQNLFNDENVCVYMKDKNDVREFNVDHTDFKLVIYHDKLHDYYIVQIERKDHEFFSPYKNQSWCRTFKVGFETLHKYEEFEENAIKLIQRTVREWLYNPDRSGYGARRLLDKYPK